MPKFMNSKICLCRLQNKLKIVYQMSYKLMFSWKKHMNIRKVEDICTAIFLLPWLLLSGFGNILIRKPIIINEDTIY